MPVKYHNKKACAGQACCIHNPSKHHMVDWPLVLRESTLMERKCPHGIGHPDPDSLAWMERNGRKGYGVHGCDGCCQKPKALRTASTLVEALLALIEAEGDVYIELEDGVLLEGLSHHGGTACLHGTRASS